MATFSHVAGQEPSTVTFKLATVSMVRNSTVKQQEILSIGDPDSSLALAAVLNTAPASTAWALAVREVLPSTGPFAISSVAGVVAIQGNSTVVQGTNPWIVAGASTVAQASTVWAVQLSQYSTITAVSSVGGVVTIAGNSTVAPLAGSTWNVRPVQSSAADLQATVTQASTTWAVQLSQYSTLVRANQGVGNSSGADGWPVLTVDSSNAIVKPGDSANNALRVNVVAGAAGGSTIVTVSTGSVRVHQSTAADLQATVTQASTVWAVQLSAYSTIVAISSLSGTVTIAGNSTVAPLAGSTWNTRPIQSSAADLQMTATPLAGSTWNVRALQSSATDLRAQAWTFDGIGGAIESSTKAAGSNSTMRGIAMRSLMPDCLSVSGQMSSAAANVLVSSAATRVHVYAYSLSPLTTGATLITFLSSAATELWRTRLLGTSTQHTHPVSGLSMAVSPPAYLFRTAANDGLTANITSSGMNYSLAYWRE